MHAERYLDFKLSRDTAIVKFKQRLELMSASPRQNTRPFCTCIRRRMASFALEMACMV